MTDADRSEYRYHDAGHGHHHSYLLPSVRKLLDDFGRSLEKRRLFELGCGNGSTADFLFRLGWDVTGVDPSEEGIEQATLAYPNLRLQTGSTDDDLVSRFGRFPVVLSLEVIEHVYAPRQYARAVFDLLQPGGHAILSTPYHGYLKNLALALSGRLDAHFTALWDHGHIKFWSIGTLTELLRDTGFVDISYLRIGRIPPLAKTMIAVARRP